MWKSFGSFIKYRRQRLGLTQRQLADQLGLRSAAFLSDIESGNRKPSESLFPALARVLETDIRQLQTYDTRHILAELRTLLESRPETAASFGQILTSVRNLGAEEVLHRIDAYLPPATPATEGDKKPRKPAPRRQPSAPAPATDSLL